ncbi:MAG: hypothetical protein AAGH78_08770 [Cyanobacteria bacterium P01_H01_bin.58]
MNSPNAIAIIVGLGGVAISLLPINLGLLPEQTQIGVQQPPTQPNSTPRRLTINVSVSDPDDLKVTEGDRISVGQLIADRGRERQRLEAQARQLDLTLQRLEHSHYPTATTGYASTNRNPNVSRTKRRHRPR